MTMFHSLSTALQKTETHFLPETTATRQLRTGHNVKIETPTSETTAIEKVALSHLTGVFVKAPPTAGDPILEPLPDALRSGAEDKRPDPIIPDRGALGATMPPKTATHRSPILKDLPDAAIPGAEDKLPDPIVPDRGALGATMPPKTATHRSPILKDLPDAAIPGAEDKRPDPIIPDRGALGATMPPKTATHRSPILRDLPDAAIPGAEDKRPDPIVPNREFLDKTPTSRAIDDPIREILPDAAPRRARDAGGDPITPPRSIQIPAEPPLRATQTPPAIPTQRVPSTASLNATPAARRHGVMWE